MCIFIRRCVYGDSKKSPIPLEKITTKKVKGVLKECKHLGKETLSVNCKDWVRQVLKNERRLEDQKKK